MTSILAYITTPQLARIAAVCSLLIIGPSTGVFAQQTSKGIKSSSYQYKQKVNFTNSTQTSILPDGRTIFNKADKMPEYKGDLTQFLVSNLKYPEEARKQKIQGRAVVKFIVNSDGRVSDAFVKKSSGNALLDAEALRVTGLMPDWNPGTHEGHPVDVYVQLPVSYQLD